MTEASIVDPKPRPGSRMATLEIDAACRVADAAQDGEAADGAAVAKAEEIGVAGVGNQLFMDAACGVADQMFEPGLPLDLHDCGNVLARGTAKRHCGEAFGMIGRAITMRSTAWPLGSLPAAASVVSCTNPKAT